MKKIISIVVLTLIIMLSGCGNAEKDLQANVWNVVSTNGEAYTAEFGNNTATFKYADILSFGVEYEIEGNEITIIDEKQKVYTFIIEKNKNEYIFKANNDEAKEYVGDLTLSPKKN